MSNVTVLPMTAAMIPEVAKVRLEAFRGYLSNRIGDRYVCAFIDWFGRREEAIALVTLADGEVSGYTVGAPLGYQRRMNQDLLEAALRGMLIRPWIFLDARFRHTIGGRLCILFRPKTSEHAALGLPPPAMLLVEIGVAEKWRGRRIGDRLMEAFEAAARVRGMNSLLLSVSVNNAAARKLYERRGWSPCPSPGQETMYYSLVLSASGNHLQHLSDPTRPCHAHRPSM